MTSVAKIEANRRNAMKSTGPKSPPGKVASAQNSRTHGLTAEVAAAEESMPGFAARLAEWEAEVRPATAEARHALRQAVAATFRLERCQAAYSAAVEDHAARARDAWDDDRLADASTLLGALAKRPEVVAGRLRASASGAVLMLAIWGRLGESLFTKAGEWSAEEIATACDLLGIPTHLRDARLPFDPVDPSQTDPAEFRMAFFRRECKALREASEGRLARLDRFERAQAESGASAMQAKPVRLILRYEAAARRWYRESLAAARAGVDLPAEPAKDEPLPAWRMAARAMEDLPTTQTEETSEADESPAPDRDEESLLLEQTEATSSETFADADYEPELAFAGMPGPAGAGGAPLNRHERRRREALARRGG